jgi:hypothetical protein
MAVCAPGRANYEVVLSLVSKGVKLKVPDGRSIEEML